MDPTEILPLEIWQRIHDNLDFKSKCLMSLSCGLFRNGLVIVDLFDIDNKYLMRLNDEVLKYQIFTRIKRLDAKCYYEISQEGISNLNLEELDTGGNSKITSPVPSALRLREAH